MSVYVVGFQYDSQLSTSSSTNECSAELYSDDDTQSVVSSVCFDSDDNVDDDDDGKQKQLQKKVKIKKEIVKFISKRNAFSLQLREKLKTLSADVELFPPKSLIVVTKKRGSKFIKNWGNCSASMVRTFCDRFAKTCFDIKDSGRLRKDLPKLGGKLRSTYAAYWIEDGNKKLAVMTERGEFEHVLDIVRTFLKNKGK